ncbi:MAG: LamG-like jellyroll fold domain-containing protein [Bacteroidota bacterium]
MLRTLLTTLLCQLLLGSFAQSNQYLHFDRNNDHVRLDGASQYIANISEMSMAGWFNTDQLTYGQGMMGFRGTNNGFYLIQLNNGTLECRLQTSTGLHEYVGPNFTILPGVWQHVAWVYNGSTVTLYIDGVVKGSASASGQITDANIPFTIGRSILTNLNFYFGGGADEVSVWSKALSQTEIQDMMMNELQGDEANLELYYKFNQGSPGGDNSSVTTLISEVGGGTRDGDLLNFALNGTTSNFVGTLQTGFQSISFDEIPNQLTSAAPFALTAAASSGLPVDYTVVSGPASLSGNTITLTGSAGEVVITASQPGDMAYQAAADVTKSFMVVDPNVSTPIVELRNPLAADVRVPSLQPIQLATIVSTDFPELLSVDKVQFEINGDIIPAKHWGNGHYTAFWTPPAYNTYALTIKAFNNFGATTTETNNIFVVAAAPTESKAAFTGIWISSSVFSEEIEVDLPSFVGAYDQITANLEVSCPPGGCDPWDRVAKVEIKTHEGNWVEMIRYITPYGTPCTHSLDVTDFMSALQGKIRFRVSCETFTNGYEYQLTLDYNAGTPNHAYSIIQPVWHADYDFGNPGNLQPVESKTMRFPDNTQEAKLKLIGSGHGWGDNNTNNAAEFFNTTHHIWVDDVQTFAQNNWLTCNPNPDGCQPQAGTWFFDRAGFCPGAISPWFDFDMSPYITNETAKLDYVFDQNYVDLCHANNPNCISGTTCPDCNDGFNPHLIVASSMVHFGDVPLDTAMVTSVEEEIVAETGFILFPNPTSGQVDIRIDSEQSVKIDRVVVMDMMGKAVVQFYDTHFQQNRFSMDLSSLSSGMYTVMLEGEKGRMTALLQLSK